MSGFNMTDIRLVCAEMRAAELLATLQAAVDGAPNWALQARMLLDDIEALRLPPKAVERLREIDALRRAAEIMTDLVDD